MEEGLVFLRYHDALSEKAKRRWELVEMLYDEDRRLRQFAYKAKSIHKEYSDLMYIYVEVKTNWLLRAANTFYIERRYKRRYSKVVKQFSKYVERMSFL
jgi:hypothetical protein